MQTLDQPAFPLSPTRIYGTADHDKYLMTFMTRFYSFVGRVHTAIGVVHIAVRRPVSVRVGHRVPGTDRDLRAVARTGLRPSQLRTVQGHRVDHHRHTGSGTGHVHQRTRHLQIVQLRTQDEFHPVSTLYFIYFYCNIFFLFF